MIFEGPCSLSGKIRQWSGFQLGSESFLSWQNSSFTIKDIFLWSPFKGIWGLPERVLVRVDTSSKEERPISEKAPERPLVVVSAGAWPQYTRSGGHSGAPFPLLEPWCLPGKAPPWADGFCELPFPLDGPLPASLVPSCVSSARVHSAAPCVSSSWSFSFKALVSSPGFNTHPCQWLSRLHFSCPHPHILAAPTPKVFHVIVLASSEMQYVFVRLQSCSYKPPEHNHPLTDHFTPVLPHALSFTCLKNTICHHDSSHLILTSSFWEFLKFPDYY